MMTGVTQNPGSAAGVQQVLNHSPLIGPDGKKVVEMWSAYKVDFLMGNVAGCLQPNQYVPMFDVASKQKLSDVIINVNSAKVFSSRYLVAGGDNKPSSHPSITEYAAGTAPTGAKTELLYPGGSRMVRLNPAVPFIGATKAEQHSRFKAGSNSFHSNVGRSELVTGDCPLKLAVRGVAKDAFGLMAPAFNVATLDATVVCVLPIPTILSAPEQKVVVDSAFSDWLSGAMELLQVAGATEYGLLWVGGDDVVEDVVFDAPSMVYRQPLDSQDMGFPTLDSHQLFEQLLPFQGGIYRP